MAHSQDLEGISHFAFAGTAQHFMVQFLQHAVTEVVSQTLGAATAETCAGRDRLGQAHAFTGIVPIAVETASSMQSTGR